MSDEPSNSSKRPRQDSSQSRVRPMPQRASLACIRCRSKKLRCSGRWPCETCGRAGVPCDFGSAPTSDPLEESALARKVVELERALEQLTRRLDFKPDMSPAGVDDHERNLGADTSPDDGSEMVPSTSRDGNGSPSWTSAQGDGSRELFETPEGRLGIALRPHSAFAPFSFLMYHPALWRTSVQSFVEDVQEPLDSSSRQPRPTMGMTHYEASLAWNDDPVSRGFITMDQAESLFAFFFAKCHPLFPVIMWPTQRRLPLAVTRVKSPFLFTTILGVAARFWPRYTERESSATPLPSDTAVAIVDLAYGHLGATLFRKQIHVGDIHAMLLLTTWPLRGSGLGPDHWCLSGICGRFAQRLGLDQSGLTPPIVRILSSPTSPTAADLPVIVAILKRWQSYLNWLFTDNFLCMGLGRPLTPLVGPPQEADFLAVLFSVIPLNPTDLDISAGVYTVSMVELSMIARDFAAKTNMLANRGGHVSRRFAVQLNARLEQWRGKWLSTNSPTSMLLKERRWLAELYLEHVRICVNTAPINQRTTTHALDDLEPFLTESRSAACHILKAYNHLVTAEHALVYVNWYLVNVCGHAAVFILRILAFSPDKLGGDTELSDLLCTTVNSLQRIAAVDSHSVHSAERWTAQLINDLCRAAGLPIAGVQNTPAPVGSDDTGTDAATTLLNSDMIFDWPLFESDAQQPMLPLDALEDDWLALFQ